MKVDNNTSSGFYNKDRIDSFMEKFNEDMKLNRIVLIDVEDIKRKTIEKAEKFENFLTNILEDSDKEEKL